MVMFSMHVIYLLTQMIYVSSGNLELSAKYFQDLIVKDQNHPAALMNYAAILLCKHGSIVAGRLVMSLNSCFPSVLAFLFGTTVKCSNVCYQLFVIVIGN